MHVATPHRASAGMLLAEAGSDIDIVLKDLRDLAHGLVPALLPERVLAPVLAELARRSGRAARTSIESVCRFESTIEQAVYFCRAETLPNASKHAGIGVHFEPTLEQGWRGGEIRFTVQAQHTKKTY